MVNPTEFTRERLDRFASANGVKPLDDAALAESRAAVLGSWEAGRDLWVFAYGSLIWNPALSTVETVRAQLDGWHRSFCLDLPGGRGSFDRPGLMCALVPGGYCRGVAYRILAREVESETSVLWLREMAFGGYRPLLVPLTMEGHSAVGLVFVAEPSRVVTHDLGVQARRIAVAEGALGTNREYLFALEQALAEHDLPDDYVTSLADGVRAVGW
jgi:cation transport protein ChaC